MTWLCNASTSKPREVTASRSGTRPARSDRRDVLSDSEALPAKFAAAAAEWAHDKPGLGERPVRTRPTLYLLLSGPVQRGTSGGVKGVVRCHKQRMKTAKARKSGSKRRP